MEGCTEGGTVSAGSLSEGFMGQPRARYDSVAYVSVRNSFTSPEHEVEWWFNAVSATEAIFTARTC